MGDNKRTAEAIVSKVGITNIMNEVLPNERNGRGDGISQYYVDERGFNAYS
jgi:hypothetical protein